ncbi:MAG: cysteine desulfurase NifS [Bacillota bacterium]|jgi:cysteine desulfurase
MKRIYVDNAAATSMCDEAISAMQPYFKENYANPSSIHSLGREARAVLNESRASIAAKIGAQDEEIYFTSGGTESDNWAITSMALLGAAQGKKHIITSKIEHHAVLHVLDKLLKRGFEVTYLDVYENGIVKANDVAKALRHDTALVTIMYANNEIGTIQPIQEIGEICRKAEVPFHTDAIQAAGHLPIDVVKEQIDLLSLAAHKFHGPKGVGALYCRQEIQLPSFIDGGTQERMRRGGTENVPGIVGMAAALEKVCRERSINDTKKSAMSKRLIKELLKIPHTRLNGDREKRLTGNVNLSFAGVEGESLLLALDHKGICVSTGSACSSGSLNPSHVLLSLGLSHELAHGSLRLSVSSSNTEAEIDYIIKELPPLVARLRHMSPFQRSLLKKEH